MPYGEAISEELEGILIKDNWKDYFWANEPQLRETQTA